MAKKTKSFDVSCVLKYWGSVSIEAASLEEALAEARKMEVTDFITPLGDHADSKLKIVQVYDPDFEVEL